MAAAAWVLRVYLLPAAQRDDASTFGAFALAALGIVVTAIGVLWRSAHARPRLPQRELATARDAYRQRIHERYGRVELAVLTPVAKRGEYLRIELKDVFTAPMARADTLPIELPRDLTLRIVDERDAPVTTTTSLISEHQVQAVRQYYQRGLPLPVLDLISESSRQKIVLLGDPGSGKSALARYIALLLSEDSEFGPLQSLAGSLPVLVELKTYADPRYRGGTFLDFVDDLYAKQGLGLPRALLAQYLEQDGRAIFMFDGLDEIFDTLVREEVTNEIAGFAARYPNVRIIVTSRVLGYKRDILDAAGFAHHQLEDLNLEQIRRFATTWYGACNPEDPKEAYRLRSQFLAGLEQSSAVRALAGNPMLLTILAIIGRTQQLPRDRRSVYEHAVSVLVDDWDVTKHLRDAQIASEMPYLDHQAKLNLLLVVARRMQNSQAGIAGNSIAGADLREELDAYLRITYDLPAYRSRPAANAMLRQLRERNFILCLFGNELYGFIHRSFLEYLAAVDISRDLDMSEQSSKRIISVFEQHWHDPAWHEVLLLVTGLVDRIGARIIAALLAANPLWFLSSRVALDHVLLAVRCFGEVGDSQESLRAAVLILNEVTGLLELSEFVPERYGSGTPWNDKIPEEISSTLLEVFAKPEVAKSCLTLYEEWFLTRGILLSRRISTESAAFLAARIHATLIAGNTNSPDFLLAEAFNESENGGLEHVQEAALRALALRWPEDDRVLGALKKLAAQIGSARIACAAIDVLAATWGSDPETKLWLEEALLATRHSELVRAALIAAVVPGRSGD